MQILPLSEGAFTVDKTKDFIPFDTEQDRINERTAGSLLVEIQPFAVITQKDIILFDTGLGFKKNGILQIHSNLSEHNINPDQVTKVLISHLHKDHSGGISEKDETVEYHLAFRSATYYVQQREFDFAMETGFPSFIPEKIHTLNNNPQVIFLNGNGVIDDYITYEMSGGHSTYHQVFWVEENNEIIFFGGDEAPQLQQMKSRLVAKYDFNGKRAMELRRKWWEEGNRENWTFLFYHDVKTPYWNSVGKF